MSVSNLIIGTLNARTLKKITAIQYGETETSTQE